MPIDIDHLSIEELEALNERIVARLKFLDKVRAHHDMMAFNIGNRVGFDSPRHGWQVGTLVKFNLKTVTVVTAIGRRWNVSPHLLSPVKDVSTVHRPEPTGGKRLKQPTSNTIDHMIAAKCNDGVV